MSASFSTRPASTGRGTTSNHSGIVSTTRSSSCRSLKRALRRTMRAGTVFATPGTVSLMRASSSYRRPYTASRAPRVAELDVLSSDVGFTEFTMMFWLPSRLMDSSA